MSDNENYVKREVLGQASAFFGVVSSLQALPHSASGSDV